MRKIKVLKASPFYDEYLRNIYSENIELSKLSYYEQYAFIMDDKFAWNNIWKVELESLGNFEVLEVMLNNEYSQKKWAEENKISFSTDNWILEILEAQINYFEPDVFFAHDQRHLNSEVVLNLKKRFPFIKTVMGYDGIALNNIERFTNYDIVLSCLEDTANYYSSNSNGKIKGYFFPLAFDTSILKKINTSNIKIPFSFIGSLERYEGLHNRRIEEIAKLAKSTNISIFSAGLKEPHEAYRYLQRNRLYKLNFKEFWQVYHIQKNREEPVYGMKMYNTLAASRITFNSHVDVAGSKAANMRLFEATGVGTCLVTDYKDNLTNFFDIDNEVVTYKSINECIDKVKNLLRNDELRTKIAIAGQKRTLKEHSYNLRISEFAKFLEL
jgi:spore maturation protein CgeB